ncbi:hypothetical protein [Vibrio vulnificus]|uniref:hypothetical protein n=1 Tax=Vibrio vulnificus TaxID=672 RepID=UPI003241BC54
MSEKFNPYEPSITATKKAIDTRQAKLNELKDLENKALDDVYRRELMMDIGRTEAEVEFSIGAKKRGAENKLKKLNKQATQLNNVFTEKSTNLMFKWEDEIRALNKALVQLHNLSMRWKDHVGYVGSFG